MSFSGFLVAKNKGSFQARSIEVKRNSRNRNSLINTYLTVILNECAEPDPVLDRDTIPFLLMERELVNDCQPHT